MFILSILFFITAGIYSSVGFGGGSTYLALLLLSGISYSIFPVIALFCNIIVVSGNCFNYIKANDFSFKFLYPFLIGSIPFAFLGGSLQLEKNLFELFLFMVLTAAGCLLLFNFKNYDDQDSTYKNISFPFSILIGSILGFVSGVVGIGGGIFLSPILFLLKAAKPRIIITSASLFILINSFFGIVGQLTKANIIQEAITYWPLMFAVFLGGQIGNYINLKLLPNRILALVTACVVLFVSARLGIKIFF